MHTVHSSKYLLVLTALFCFVSGTFSLQAHAESISIQGNGAESASAVSSSQNQDTSVSSSNSTETATTVETTAETGNNSVSGNTGDAQVKTGDVTNTTDITNAGNISQVEQPCCSNKGTINITSDGNGSGSNNVTNHTQNNNATVTINQHAAITNTITGKVNTGGNKANNNSGDIRIISGNISVRDRITNGPVNQAYVTIGFGSEDSTVTNSGNGHDSQNSINFLISNTTTIHVNNYADIFNNVFYDLSTGNNEANDNNGHVDILTGDIKVTTEIINEVNTSEVKVDCRCQEKPEEKPTPTPPADKVTPTPSNGGGNGGGGEVASVSSEKTLPVTGINWLVLAIVGNVMMLLLGMILRLRSGNSPGFTL